MQHCLDICLSVGGCTVRVGAALQHDDAMVDKGKKSYASSFGLVLLLQQLNGGGGAAGAAPTTWHKYMHRWVSSRVMMRWNRRCIRKSVRTMCLLLSISSPFLLLCDYLRMQNSFLVIIIIYIDRTRFIAKRKRALWICSLQPPLLASQQHPVAT